MKSYFKTKMRVFLELCVQGKLFWYFTNKYLRKIIRVIDKLISFAFIYVLSRNTKIDDKKIVFISFRGAYDCNPKWISEELIRRKNDIKLVWLYRDVNSVSNFPKEIILAKRTSLDSYKHLSSAKIIVDNSTSVSYLGYRKKRDQVLIQTWHGAIGIKRFGKETNKDKIWLLKAKEEAKMTDYCISNSQMEDEVYRDTFWKKTKILRYGHPRNDILFEIESDRSLKIKESIFSKYKIDNNTKICLYAPTFRDNGDFSVYSIDYTSLLEALENRFGGTWVVMVRFHFRVMSKINNNITSRKIIDVSEYSDIQELLTCVDVGITDYSSWICEYMLTKKPGFLFATDINDYRKNDREFYYPLETMPFPLSRNNEELVSNILNFNEQKFKTECNNFLLSKGCVDDGHASERVCDLVKKIMFNENDNSELSV